MIVLFGSDFCLLQILGDIIGHYQLLDDASHSMSTVFLFSRSCRVQLITIKLYSTTDMVKVLMASIVLAELNSIFDIALTRL